MTLKKLLAGACALTVCCGLAACGGSNADSGSGDASSVPQTVAHDEKEEELIGNIADKLEDIELENKNIKFFSHWDINPGEGQKTSPELQLFKDKYDGTIEYVQTTWDARYTDLAKLIMANDSPDFFSAMDMDGFPKGAIKAMFEPIDDYIDLDSDLWAPAKVTNDNFVFNGGHYVAGVQSYPQFVCVYNTKTIADNGLDDPAELYWKDEWTWSNFSKMCIDFTDQDNDIVGLDGWWYAQALNDTCGVPLIGLKDGQLVNNMNDPQVAKVQELMYDLQKNDVCYDRAANNWSTRGGGVTGEGLGTYQTLFIPVGLWGVEGIPSSVTAFGDVEAGEIMFVPMPRMDDSDKYYVTARVDGYFLCKNAPNPEGWAAFMNCRMNALADSEELTLKTEQEDYLWNDDMINMRKEILRLVNENPVYDFQDGVSAELSSTMQDVRQATMITGGNTSTWTATVSEYEKAVDYLIKEANENIQTEPTAE